MGFLIKVFREARILTVASKSFFVFLVPGGELATSLPNVRFVTAGAGEFVHPR